LTRFAPEQPAAARRLVGTLDLLVELEGLSQVLIVAEADPLRAQEDAPGVVVLADPLLGVRYRSVRIRMADPGIHLRPAGQIGRQEPGRLELGPEALRRTVDQAFVELDVRLHQDHAGFVAPRSGRELLGDLEPVTRSLLAAEAEDRPGACDRGREGSERWPL